MLWTLLLSLLLGSSHASEGATESLRRLQYDPVLESPLSELLLAPLATEDGDEPTPLDAQLQSAFFQCRELGIASPLYEMSTDNPGPAVDPQDVTYCNRLRYLRHQRQHIRAVRKEVAIQHKEAGGDNGIERKPVDEVNFQDFFELYAEKARPVLLELAQGRLPLAQMLGLAGGNGDAETSDDILRDFLSVCFGEGGGASVGSGQIKTTPLRVKDEKCVALLNSTVRVPIYMTHDYVQRTNASRDEAFLPAIVEVSPVSNDKKENSERAKDIVACPYGMHMLMIPLGDSVGARVSLFRRKFAPIVPPSGATGQLREIVLGADANLAARQADGTILDTSIFQKAPQLYESFELKSESDMLFVPGGIIPTMSTAESSSLSGAKALRFCFCDAANIKEVKQAAGLDVLLMAEDTDKDGGVYAMLYEFQSPSFDSSFTRRPTLSDTHWSSFVQWPRESVYLSKKSRRARNGDNQDGEEEQLSRRERLKQWQDDKRWERYIASLTLPVARPPIVVNTTRTTATLRWQELYQPLKHDLTSYGYEVSWKCEDQNTTDSIYAEGAVNVTHDQLIRSRLPSTLFGDDFDGRDLEAVITGLQAESAYSFSVRLLVGEGRGAISGSSRRITTSPCAPPARTRGVPTARDIDGTCVALQWLDPEDDGGKKIELYLVSSERLPGKGEGDSLSTGAGADDASVIREHEKIIAVDGALENGQVKREVSMSGVGWLSTRVCGLFPGASYVFRIAAMNVLGAGLWSPRSSRLSIPPSPHRRLVSSESGRNSQGFVVPTMKGVGDPTYFVVRGIDILSQSDLSSLVAEDPQRILRTSGAQISDSMLPRVVLSDVEERLHLLPNSSSGDGSDVAHTFEAWASHYSPRLFDVSAELVLADPPDAAEPLHNADAVRDRVVLALRGGVPLVFKLYYAQRAGALGLVIADASGFCAGGFDQGCVPGSDKNRHEGFAAREQHSLWSQERIPCVLVLQEAASALLERLGSKMATLALN